MRGKTHEWPVGSGNRYPVVDAGKIYGEGHRLAVDLGALAQMSGIRCDCEHCVVARALVKELGAIHAYVGYSRAWVLRLVTVGPYRGQTVWERWAHDFGRALRVFDKGGEAPARVVLRAPNKTETQEAKKAQNQSRPNWPSTAKDGQRKINRGTPRYAGMGGRNMPQLARTKENA